ncbi:MAG: hypothetical protein KDK50_05765 [Chlamydiia bacterium]|nr:hypothetical protein [Chlamydiia bacterium]
MFSICIFLAVSVQAILAGHEKELIKAIDDEKTHIQVAIYSFTNKRIADHLIKTHKKGVEVEVFVDPFSQTAGDAVDLLLKEGVPVYRYTPKEQRCWTSTCHHKFCTFESQQGVWTGSYNFTYKAENSNRENAVYIMGDKTSYEQFAREFDSLKAMGERLKVIEESPTIKNDG